MLCVREYFAHISDTESKYQYLLAKMFRCSSEHESRNRKRDYSHMDEKEVRRVVKDYSDMVHQMLKGGATDGGRMKGKLDIKKMAI